MIIKFYISNNKLVIKFSKYLLNFYIFIYTIFIILYILIPHIDFILIICFHMLNVKNYK